MEQWRTCARCGKQNIQRGVHFTLAIVGEQATAQYDICDPCFVAKRPLIIPAALVRSGVTTQYCVDFESFDTRQEPH